jgi:hypothetical protein
MKNISFRLLIICVLIFLSKPTPAQNILTNSGFNNPAYIEPFFINPQPLNKWCSWANYYGTGAWFYPFVQNGVCTSYITNPGTNTWDIQLIQWGFPLIQGKHYWLTFDVKADADRSFGVFIGEDGGNWTNLNTSYLQQATTSWQTKIIEFDAIAVFPLHKLSFEMGTQNITLEFRNIQLQITPRCGNKNKSYVLCHKEKTLCVGYDDALIHFAHGDSFGECTTASIASSSYLVPETFIPETLKISSFPNPFINSTTIKYELPFDSKVSIKVYDAMGKEVASLINSEKKAGIYTANFDASRLSKGMYYYKLSAATKEKVFNQSGKMMKQ